MLVQAGATVYTQDLASPLSQILNDGSANYIYGLDRLASSAGTWYLGDALGSVRQTLDASGAVLNTASYDPWGTPVAGMIAPFGFTGELQNSAGQVYLRARWYNAVHGTFTSRDPFAGWPEQPASLSYYQYAANDPALLTDPSGQCVGILAGVDTAICVGIVLAALGLAGGVVATTPPGQAALADAQRAFTQAAQGVETMRAQAIWTAFDTLGGLVPVPEGFNLDAPNPSTALIFVLVYGSCALHSGGFTLRTPNMSDIVRLGPQVAEVLKGLINTGHPWPEADTNIIYSATNHATFGSSTSTDYKENFFTTYPSLRGKVWVHHAVEQQVMRRYPGLVTDSELHSVENLRGIPNNINADVHLSKIRKMWNEFYRKHPTTTKEELLDQATKIDDMFGHLFNPKIR